jgi:hypothetical protein
MSRGCGDCASERLIAGYSGTEASRHGRQSLDLCFEILDDGFLASAAKLAKRHQQNRGMHRFCRPSGRPMKPFYDRREAVLKQRYTIKTMLSDMEAANGYDREDPLSPGSRMPNRS